MGFATIWKCSRCGYKVTTSGDWEFYRDSRGHRRPYGHPVPMSMIAERAGVKGFTRKGYCPNCHITKKVIVKEFENPIYGSPWKSELPAVDYEPICPSCGIELKEDLEGSICPICSQGYLLVHDRYIS